MDNQTKINSFLAELKQLCEKHEVKICSSYDEPVYLYENDGEKLSEDIDFNEYKAEKYVEKIYVRDPDFKQVSFAEASKALKEFYVQPMKEFLETPTALENLIKRE